MNVSQIASILMALWTLTSIPTYSSASCMATLLITVANIPIYADLASGQILYTVAKQAIGMGANEQQAIDAARRQLAQKAIGQELAASLP